MTEQSQKPRETWQRCVDLAQIITSIVGIVATITAIYFSNRALKLTEETLKLERSYKEISIAPHVTVVHNGRTASMYLLNEGSGPARFSDFIANYKGNCIRLGENDKMRRTMRIFAADVEKLVEKYFGSEISKKLDQYRHRSGTPHQYSTIISNGTFEIFQFVELASAIDKSDKDSDVPAKFYDELFNSWKIYAQIKSASGVTSTSIGNVGIMTECRS